MSSACLRRMYYMCGGKSFRELLINYCVSPRGVLLNQKLTRFGKITSEKPLVRDNQIAVAIPLLYGNTRILINYNSDRVY